MGKIVILDNPLDTTQRREYAHTGPLIDWLLSHYPDGFDRPHVCAFNAQRLDVADYDREVGENNVVVIGLAPTAPLAAAFAAITWAAVAKAVLTTVISLALSYLANSVFGRAGSSGSKTAGRALPDPSPTYSLSVPTNVARLGQPIPVIYGRVVSTPDLAMTPYSWYENNDMYVGMLFCLGQGWHEVEDLRVAATPASQLPPGTLTYRVFAPDEHAQTFGVIQNTMGFWENIYTSPEVADQELDNTYVPQGECYWIIQNSIDCDGYFRIEAVESEPRFNPITGVASECLGNMPPIPALLPDCLAVGQTVDITYNGQTTTHVVTGFWKDYASAWITTNPPPSCRNEDYPPGDDDQPRIRFSCQASSGGGSTCGDGGVGPFVACPPGWTMRWLQVDVVFPGGLYQANQDGTLGVASVGLLFTAHAVNDDGEYLGQSYSFPHTFSAAANSPQRHTLTWMLPAARYAVCARRTTAKSGRVIDQSQVLWTGLKAILDSKGLPVYGQTTIIALKAKATNGLATDALNRFSVTCTRQLPDYLDADSDGNLTERVASDNHARAFADIFTNTWYGAARPASEVDWDALAALEARTADAPGFNAVFDQQVSVWEALTLAGAPVHAFPATNGNVLTVVEDIARATATHAFTASNIVQDSLQLSYKFNDLGTADGVEIEYRDPTSFQQAFYTWPLTAQYPEKLVLFGCTNAAEAQAYARRTWRQRRYRREFISFQTELEGHLPLIGELICVDHPLLASATGYIVGSITPGDDQRVTIEGHRYVAAVYAEES